MVSRILLIEGSILEAVGIIWISWKYESYEGYVSKFVGSPFEFILKATGKYREEIEYYLFQIVILVGGIILQIMSFLKHQ